MHGVGEFGFRGAARENWLGHSDENTKTGKSEVGYLSGQAFLKENLGEAPKTNRLWAWPGQGAG